MKPFKTLLSACALLALPVLLACGGGGGGDNNQPTVAVTIAPVTANLTTGGTQTFTATVTGSSNTSVTWAVSEAAGGTVSVGGLYTAPATAGTFHVVATSVADTSKHATATVTVSVPTATSLAYTDPATGTYKLVKNVSSSGSHLVLDLVGPASGTAMGVSITLTGDAHTTWVDVPAGGTTAVLMQNGSQFILGSGTPIQKAKASGNVLQVTVAQKAPTAAASLNGVLLRVALDLKTGQNLAQGTALTLTSDAVKCQVLDGTGTISSIPVSVGTLSAQ
ncbi:MAG TPA: hypothetical protein VJ486_01140 [Geothrix sp.]|nr:hypothetical protein [Geothrix sp.]